MTEAEEYDEACGEAGDLAIKGKTAAEIASALNRKFEGSFFESGGVVYMRRELDYLPPRIVANFS